MIVSILDESHSKLSFHAFFLKKKNVLSVSHLLSSDAVRCSFALTLTHAHNSTFFLSFSFHSETRSVGGRGDAEADSEPQGGSRGCDLRQERCVTADIDSQMPRPITVCPSSELSHSVWAKCGLS